MARSDSPKVCQPGQLMVKDLAKQKRAFELRMERWSHRQIAAELDLSMATVAKYISDGIRDYLPTEDIAAVRKQEADELDTLALMCRRIAASAISPDDALKVADRLIKIQERRARLLGIDAPVKVDVTATVTIDNLDANIEALAAELSGGVMLSDSKYVKVGTDVEDA